MHSNSYVCSYRLPQVAAEGLENRGGRHTAGRWSRDASYL